MPFDPLVTAIVSAIAASVGEGVVNPAPAAPTMGIVRELPAEARSGEMEPPWQGQVRIDGKTYALSPGAQIRNELNMIVLPSMVQAPVKVRYQADASGAVHRVWILSAAEVALPEKR